MHDIQRIVLLHYLLDFEEINDKKDPSDKEDKGFTLMEPKMLAIIRINTISKPEKFEILVDKGMFLVIKTRYQINMRQFRFIRSRYLFNSYGELEVFDKLIYI